jgi:type I restriction enzyme R subunit
MATGTGKTRVSIGLSELLIRNNWAKNILFLADRRSLVRQAHKNYRKLLINETTTVLSENREPDMNARIMFSTYQTMIRYIDSEEKDFSIGRFDLIIIDEAHRSVFGKYGAIFDYFDSLVIGLTATPREEIDRSTYSLLQLDEGNPNYAYEYANAVRDGHLVSYRAFCRSSKIMSEGIKYSDLSEDEKQQLEEVWEYERAKQLLDDQEEPGRDIRGNEIYSYLFNIDTVDQVLQELMEKGIRVKDGTEIGKTIIFAFNHKHAQLIVDRFHHLYQELGENYCVLIDNHVNYAENLVDIFSTPREESQQYIPIAVSVDMLDTGVDVPDCVNLVFFKQVRSKIKFNQMIGRGTRLCPNLFGEGQGKKEFYIFDYCGNFDFFEIYPEGVENSRQVTLSERLFNARLDLAVLLQHVQYQSEEFPRALCTQLKDILHEQVQSLNKSHIAVRKHWERVEKYSKRDNWQYVSEVEAQFLRNTIAPLVAVDNNEFAALKFDLLCLIEQLSLIDETVNGTMAMNKIRSIGGLLEERASLPLVYAKKDLIREIQTATFWESVLSSPIIGLQKLEHVREELRDLMQYIIGSSKRTFDIDIKDTITDDGEAAPILTAMTYRERVLDYLNENIDNPTLQKIYRMEQLSESDIRELERIFWQELGTKDEYRQTYENQDRYRIWGGRIAAFLRSILGIDQQLAREKYIQLIQGEDLTPEQDEYLSDIINYVCENGDITRETIGQEPFSGANLTSLFNDRLSALVNYINNMHQVIEA